MQLSVHTQFGPPSQKRTPLFVYQEDESRTKRFKIRRYIWFCLIVLDFSGQPQITPSITTVVERIVRVPFFARPTVALVIEDADHSTI